MSEVAQGEGSHAAEGATVILRGHGVAEGIVSGLAYRYSRDVLSIEHVRIPNTLVDDEVGQLMAAIGAAEEELDQLYRGLKARGVLQGDHLSLLVAHKLMLRDPSVIEDTVACIRGQRLNAAWALETVLTRLTEAFDTVADPFFRERGQDVLHVGMRIQRYLGGGDLAAGPPNITGFVKGRVVIAAAMSPTEVLDAAHFGVAALVLETGSTSSHAAIVARSLGLPAVVGVARAASEIGHGDRLLVDGGEGEVVVRPGRRASLRYDRRARVERALRQSVGANRELPARTLDGYEVALRANLDFASQVGAVWVNGGRGVGLFRSEFLFLQAREEPSEQRQYEAYAELVTAMAPHPVTIRTLDAGGDKAIQLEGAPQASTELRAIRYCLANEDLFLRQLRALLRAAHHGALRVMLPFITCVSEVRKVRGLLAQARLSLVRDGVPHAATVPLGVMVELPAAALIADLLAQEADFLSVGTNDLLQYMTAVSRDSVQSSHLSDPLHPAFLRLLAMVSEAAHSAQITVSLCGEMARHPRYTPLLLALGFDALSMAPQAIPRVKAMIRKSRRADGVSLLKRLSQTRDVAEAKALVAAYQDDHAATLQQETAPQYAP